MNWNKKLSELEQRALASYVLNPENDCGVVKRIYDYDFMDEGLEQTLYCFDKSEEYVFVVRQKGYVMNVLYIDGSEVEEFISYWDQGKLEPYGTLKDESARN